MTDGRSPAPSPAPPSSCPGQAAGAAQRKRPDTLPLQHRRGAVEPATASEDRRTVEVIWTTGATVRRRDFWTGKSYDEELVVSDNAVDLTRLNNGAPLLNSHGMYDLGDVIGVVERAWIAGGQGRAVVRFSERDEVEPVWRDVVGGIIRSISVGYSVDTYEVVERDGQVPLWRAVDWQPWELSAVPIGADAGAGFRYHQGQRTFPVRYITPTTRQEVSMDGPTPDRPEAPADGDTTTLYERGVTAERQRTAAIRTAGRQLGVDDQIITRLIAEGATEDLARRRLVDAAAEADERMPMYPHVRVMRDEGDTLRTRIGDLLHARLVGREPPAQSHEFRGRRLQDLLELDREYGGGWSQRGGRTGDWITQRAGGLHTTSDFPVLAGAAQRTLLDFYAAQRSPMLDLARRNDLGDFRAVQRVRLGEAPSLLKVVEHGTVSRGAAGEQAEPIQLQTYARIFGLTRQMIVNDDLGAFADQLRWWASAGAALEAELLVAALSQTMSDGTALFDAAHNNVAASGAAPSVTTLSAGRQAMRTQTGIDGARIVGAPPRYLLTGPATETTAEQVVAQIMPAAAEDVNPFGGRLTVMTEPRIAGAEWFLFADPAVMPAIEYAYLTAQPGPQLEVREGFELLGSEYRLLLDFGAAAIDWRGAYKNPGS